MSPRKASSKAPAAGLPRWLMIAGIAALVLLVAVDPLVHGHPKFGVDGSFAFYAWYGFGASIALVAVAKVVGVFLKRRDTYYD